MGVALYLKTSHSPTPVSGDLLGEMFIVFLLVLLAPLLSGPLRVPVIVVETLLGILLGPSFLGLLEDSHWLSAMALIGFIYLMFMVGLEIEVDVLKEEFTRALAIALASFAAPFILGCLVAVYYGLPPEFIGVALSTTSMGVVLPTVRELPQKARVRQVLLGAAVLVDVISMLALAYVIEEKSPTLHGLVLLSSAALTLAVAVMILKRWMPANARLSALVEAYHLDVRLCIALIFGFAVLAEVIGVHAIVGSFLVGLVIAELRGRAGLLLDKLLSFGYGFFIPVFFIAVGVKTDIWLVIGSVEGLEIMLSLLLAGFAGKLLGTYYTSRLLGFSRHESLSMGFAMSARLSLIIAAAEIGLTIGVIEAEIYSTLILLAIISVVLSPTLAKALIGRGVVKVPEETPIP